MYTNRVFGTEKFVSFIDTWCPHFRVSQVNTFRGLCYSGTQDKDTLINRTHFAAANTAPEIRTPH